MAARIAAPQQMASAVQPKLADVEETPRTQTVRPRADPLEDAPEHRRKHVCGVDIGLCDGCQSGAELAELGLDHRTNEAGELIDDRQGRIEADRADFDDLHLAPWARRIPTRRFQVHHDQVHGLDVIRARRRNADEFGWP